MNSNKLISSLCYFSIFFAGFIFPIAVYFIVDEHEVKSHALKALFSHLVPLITIPFILVPFFTLTTLEAIAVVFILLGILILLLNIAVLIYNVVKGIQLLRGV
ncbi:hypothetical protein LCL95_10780 [Bacillus timonensis]|nr:hypothetical protein [Bacillus timonensis]